METWATVTIVLVSYSIIAASSYLVGRLQANSADKRLEMQLKSQRETDRTERRREVRSEPLLKLRAELARMAAMHRNLIRINLEFAGRGNRKGEEAEVQRAVEAWQKHVDSGEWEQVLFALDDTELIDMASEVRNDYIESWIAAEHWEDLDLSEKGRVRHALEANNPKLARIQSLINQRLEEL